MGVNLTISRVKVPENKILGTVNSLGLFEVDWDDFGEVIDKIECRDGLPVLYDLTRGRLIQDDGILYLDPVEKLFLSDMICLMSGRGIFLTKDKRRLIPLIKAEIAYKAFQKIIPLIPFFKEEGLIDKDPDRAQIKYEENKLLEIYELLKSAVEENNLVMREIG